jgi:hypothetical protein
MVDWRLKAKAVLYTPCRRLGEMIYSSYSFLTSALDKGWVVSVTPRPRFSPRERTPVPIVQEAGPRAGLDTGAREKILLFLPGIEPRSPGRPVRIRHYTDWATSAPGMMITSRKIKELGEKPAQCHSVHHKSHMNWPGRESGSPQQANNRFSNGTVCNLYYTSELYISVFLKHFAIADHFKGGRSTCRPRS